MSEKCGCGEWACWWNDAGVGFCQAHLVGRDRFLHDMRAALVQHDYESTPRSASSTWRKAAGLAAEAKAEGMARVDANADARWKVDALAAVVGVAKRMSEFTPDDIWDTGLPKPREARALGPIMSKAARSSFIRKTNRVAPTRQEKSHGTDVAVWESLIMEET